MEFDKKLLNVLACPLCKGKLHYDRNKAELVCKFDRLSFPIREDVPVMLVSEARELKNNE